MTIHQIECFLEAARTLNFTEAANHLYISQQGLSRQIASLEKELELRLFDRTTRDVRLTRSGELLLWRWKDIPKEIYDSVDMAREEGERAKRRINLSVVGMSGIIEMAGNILADYMAFDPEVEFEINEFTNIKDITNGNPDLMMTVSFTPSYEQLKEKCGLMVIKKPKRRQWRMKRACFEEGSQSADMKYPLIGLSRRCIPSWVISALRAALRRLRSETRLRA